MTCSRLSPYFVKKIIHLIILVRNFDCRSGLFKVNIKPFSLVYLLMHGQCTMLRSRKNFGKFLIHNFKNLKSNGLLFVFQHSIYRRRITQIHPTSLPPNLSGTSQSEFNCEVLFSSVRTAVTTQFIRDLKETIISIFNEGIELGTN